MLVFYNGEVSSWLTSAVSDTPLQCAAFAFTECGHCNGRTILLVPAIHPRIHYIALWRWFCLLTTHKKTTKLTHLTFGEKTPT